MTARDLAPNPASLSLVRGDLTLDDLEKPVVVRLDSRGRRLNRWLAPRERFAQRITEVPSPDGFNTPCWQWDKPHPGHGYGLFHDKVPFLAHRWSYQTFVGPVPDGLHLDHLCRNRACVNPSHLEPVTPRENMVRGISPWAIKARATECKHGHPFDEENTIARPNGNRACRACQEAAIKRYHERRKAALA